MSISKPVPYDFFEQAAKDRIAAFDLLYGLTTRKSDNWLDNSNPTNWDIQNEKFLVVLTDFVVNYLGLPSLESLTLNKVRHMTYGQMRQSLKFSEPQAILLKKTIKAVGGVFFDELGKHDIVHDQFAIGNMRAAEDDFSTIEMKNEAIAPTILSILQKKSLAKSQLVLLQEDQIQNTMDIVNGLRQQGCIVTVQLSVQKNDNALLPPALTAS